ncbi:hypothetical protein PSTT_10722 [Puccinia striiformis]|uniref:Uncharacterized protein n=1 Tax=Puccinia striiformis TaxID=27350 RepID=A0A2S4V3C4_9BASI|nr:hypothetical protein PSTT_10722 [Puccinia striiformis]
MKGGSASSSGIVQPLMTAPSPMETLAKERLECPFDLWRMTCVYMVVKIVLLKDKFMQEIERDPALDWTIFIPH